MEGPFPHYAPITHCPRSPIALLLLSPESFPLLLLFPFNFKTAPPARPYFIPLVGSTKDCDIRPEIMGRYLHRKGEIALEGDGKVESKV